MSDPNSIAPILVARRVNKSFPGVQALQEVDFELVPGEIHALVGENGAGKSTLIKILCGALEPDDGQVIIEEETIRSFDPRLATEHRIGVVYQHFSLVPPLSVAENIFLGHLPRSGAGAIDWQAVHRDAEEVLSIFNLDVDPRQPISTLSTAQKQMIEVAKAFAQKQRILMLDEPTSALSEVEKELLFDTVRTFASQGGAVIYISHRLEEIFEIADRVTILRDGVRVGTFPIEDLSHDDVVEMVVGHELTRETESGVGGPGRGEEVLKVEHVEVRDTVVEDVSFTLHKGEVLGIAGPMGSGRSELLRAIFGLLRISSGTLTLRGERITPFTSPQQAISNGIGFLGEDRGESLILCLSVANNLTLASAERIFERGLLKRQNEESLAKEYVERLDIRTPSLWQRIQLLSGGNQQKVLLARWMCSAVDILLLDEPVLGIDVGAKEEVAVVVRELAESGMSIVIVSSEIPNLLEMADRVLVMRNGRMVGEFEASQAVEDHIVQTILAGGSEENPRSISQHTEESA